MKTLHRLTYLAVIYGLLLAAARADENSAPYFQIVGNRDAAASESLPLKSSSAKVSIDGTIAKVHLTQRYANSGNVPIEAIYVFPASTRAAVHGMTLTTGGRVIAAKIKESVKAKGVGHVAAWNARRRIGLTTDLTGGFCTSRSEREFTLEESWYANEET